MDIVYQNHGCATKLTIAKTEVTNLVVICVKKPSTSVVGTEDVFHSLLSVTRITTAVTEAMKLSVEH